MGPCSWTLRVFLSSWVTCYAAAHLSLLVVSRSCVIGAPVFGTLRWLRRFNYFSGQRASAKEPEGPYRLLEVSNFCAIGRRVMNRFPWPCDLCGFDASNWLCFLKGVFYRYFPSFSIKRYKLPGMWSITCVLHSSVIFTFPSRVAVIVKAFSKISFASLGLLGTIAKPELTFRTVFRESFSNPRFVFRANLIACTFRVRLGWFSANLTNILFSVFFIFWIYGMGTKEGFSGWNTAELTDEVFLATWAYICGTLYFAWAWKILWLRGISSRESWLEIVSAIANCLRSCAIAKFRSIVKLSKPNSHSRLVASSYASEYSLTTLSRFKYARRVSLNASSIAFIRIPAGAADLGIFMSDSNRSTVLKGAHWV